MNPVEEIKSALRSMIMSALEKAQAEQALSIEAVPDFVIEVPRERAWRFCPQCSHAAGKISSPVTPRDCPDYCRITWTRRRFCISTG